MNYGCIGMWHFRVVVSLMMAVCCTRLFVNVLLCDIDVECISRGANITNGTEKMMVFTFVD